MASASSFLTWLRALTSELMPVCSSPPPRSFLNLVLEFLILPENLFILSGVFRQSPNIGSFQNHPTMRDEDEDVKAERLKVKELMSCQCCEEVSWSLLLGRPQWSAMVSSSHTERVNLEKNSPLSYDSIWKSPVFEKLFLSNYF